MKSVGIYEAKTQLPKLIDEVNEGETIVITRHGKPVARLMPMEVPTRDIAEVIESIRRNPQGNNLDGVSIRDLIEEGRE